MRRFDLVMIRESAVDEVADFFDTLVGRPFVRLPENEFPERSRDLADPNVAAWKGKIDCDGQWCEVTFALKSTFPDTIPRVYLVHPFALIPHVTQTRERHVCSVAQDGVLVNSRAPVGVVLETLGAAARVISDGLSGRNHDQFDLDFRAYWADETRKAVGLSTIIPGGHARQVYLFEVEPPKGRFSQVFSETRQQGEHWLRNLGRNVNKSPEKALYLPLLRPFRPPFPSTNIEVYRQLDATDPKHLESLLDYLTGAQQEVQSVIFSFEVKGNHAFGGWIHFRPRRVKGFRNNRIPGRIQLRSPRTRNIPIIRLEIERVDMSRLQGRVGNDEAPNLLEKHVAVLGCGSVGSRIALALALSGIGRLTLIDKEELAVENVVRHICPLSSVGLKKVEAVSKEIHARLPEVKVEEEPVDLYHVLANDTQVFSDIDLVISATGDKNLSLRFNEFHISDGSAFSTIHSWIEAFGIASHSNLVVPGRGGCLNCVLGEDGNFKHRVITSPPSETLTREAGCGSIFSPYSGLDAELAANTAVRLAISFLTVEVERSVRWTYLGSLASAKALNLTISPQYEVSGSNRLVESTLPSSTRCEVCKG